MIKLFEISGHSKKSANAVRIRVRAVDYWDARMKGRKTGMVVDRIVMIEPVTPSEQRS
jgi:hypothetical protein